MTIFLIVIVVAIVAIIVVSKSKSKKDTFRERQELIENYQRMAADTSSSDSTSDSADKVQPSSAQIPDYIQDLMDSGKKLQAVKEYKDYKHCSLKEAKDFIDAHC